MLSGRRNILWLKAGFSLGWKRPFFPHYPYWWADWTAAKAERLSLCMVGAGSSALLRLISRHSRALYSFGSRPLALRGDLACGPGKILVKFVVDL